MSGPWTQRGVAYWTDGEGDERVFWGTGNGRLVCVQAPTGRPCPDFGPDGSGIGGRDGRASRGPTAGARDYLNAMLYSINSPPIVVRDRVIHGSQIADVRITKEAPPGWVRAWNVRTGAHEWDFHTVPNSPDEYGADTWLNESWRYSGNANVWSMLAGDDELGYVYLPTGAPTNDYYGADRPGDNLFSQSIIAVDVETGQRAWHFQAVHHGLWDYDFPTHPNLVDVTVDGRPVRALAQVSKQGFVYVFDRVTGEPLWPIEERPVPQRTNLPGEVLAPTQPFPTRPPPFEYQGVTVDDLVDFTPEIRAMALEAVADFQLGPLFTPPLRGVEGGVQGTIQRPAIDGGANWGGAGVDPETGLLYVPSQNRFSVLHFYTPDPAAGGTMPFTQGPFGGGRQPRMPQGLPPLQAAVLAHDRHRPDHRRHRLDAAQRRRRPLPQPPTAARPRPAAPRRRRPRRTAGDEDAARQRPHRGRRRRRPPARRTRQGDRPHRRVRRPAERRHRHPDDLPRRRSAVHRPDRRRRPAPDRAGAAGAGSGTVD